MPIVDHTFRRRGGMVEVIIPGSETLTYDAGTLHAVIENIEQTRTFYATETAYLQALNLYKGALRFLQGDGEQ